MSAAGLGLIGDVGATNARFALVRPDGITTVARTYVLNDYASLTDLIDAYLAQEFARPEQAVLAVASPITGDLRHAHKPSVDILDRGRAQILRA